MKKKIMLLTTLLLLTGCVKMNQEYPEGLHGWNLIHHDSKDSIEIRKYIESESRNIYLIGFEELMVNNKDRLISLKDYYKEQNKDIDKLIDDLMKDMSKDADIDALEASVYGNTEALVVSCHTSKGVKDIYIAPLNSKLGIDTDWMIKQELCGKSEPVKIDGLSLEIKKGTLKNTGVTYVITDTNNGIEISREYYRIDKYENNEWVKLGTADGTPLENLRWKMIGFKITKGKKVEIPLNWEKIYGKLNPGKYRLVKKTLDEKYFAVEFEIK